MVTSEILKHLLLLFTLASTPVPALPLMNPAFLTNSNPVTVTLPITESRTTSFTVVSKTNISTVSISTSSALTTAASPTSTLNSNSAQNFRRKPTLTIITPSPGQCFYLGGHFAVHWVETPLRDFGWTPSQKTVDIDFWNSDPHNGSHYEIAHNVDVQQDKVQWVIPQNLKFSKKYYLRMTLRWEDEGQQEEVMILHGPLTVVEWQGHWFFGTSPDAGAGHLWEVGEIFPLVWYNTITSLQNIDIILSSVNSSAYNKTVIHNVPINLGKYSFPIPSDILLGKSNYFITLQARSQSNETITAWARDGPFILENNQTITISSNS